MSINMKILEVPLNLMVQFAEILEDHQIENTVQGVSVLGDIEIVIKYGQEHQAMIKRFSDMIDEHHRNRSDAIAMRTLKKIIKVSRLENLKG